MTWATGTADAPRLYTYQEAVAHEAKVIPIRGRTPECKPLGRRDCPNLSIRKEKRNIVVKRWGMSITYRPGGAIDIRVEYSASNADRTLLRRLLGVQMYIHDGITWIGALDPATPEQQRVGFYPMKTKWMKPEVNRKYRRKYMTATLRPTAQTPTPRNYYNKYDYTMDNIVYPKRKTINRKGSAAVRARYKPFLTLLSGYLKMTADQEVPQGVARNNGHEAATFFKANKANKAKLQGDKHLDVQMELIQLMRLNRIEYFHYRLPGGGYSYRRKVNTAKVLADARKMLHDAHPAEAYVTITVTDGSIFRSRH
jgi:hypothetical protein